MTTDATTTKYGVNVKNRDEPIVYFKLLLFKHRTHHVGIFENRKQPIFDFKVKGFQPYDQSPRNFCTIIKPTPIKITDAFLHQIIVEPTIT